MYAWQGIIFLEVQMTSGDTDFFPFLLTNAVTSVAEKVMVHPTLCSPNQFLLHVFYRSSWLDCSRESV